MELKEFYEKIQGDYEGTVRRLMREDIMRKFIKKFPDDQSFTLLEVSLEGDKDEAFRAAHTLKGVSVNLGFTRLYTSSSALTEKLRANDYNEIEILFEEVKNDYNMTLKAVEQLISEE